MSLTINKNKEIVITSESNHCGYEDYHYRVNALIRLLQAQNDDLYNQDDRYYVLEMLSDMMPTIEQAKKMLEPSPH